MKIGIVGMGWVGSSIAISTLHSGLAHELWLADKKPGLAEGEAMDLSHGATFYPPARVRAVSTREMIGADAIVIAAGRGQEPGETRLDLFRENAKIIREICEAIKGTSALVVVVTNPVDLMTQVAVEVSGLPPHRVIGTGTMLDTARLRQILGRELSLDPRSVHGQVVGEHGDSEVVLWSGARVGGVALSDWPGWDKTKQKMVQDEVRLAASGIIARKGATNHAIGLVTTALLRWAWRGGRRVLTVSRMQDGAFGLHGVAISLPTLVGKNGAVTVLEPELSEGERDALHRSADVVRAARRSL